MVALTIYLVLMLLGVALLGEAMARNAPGDRIGIGAAIYSTLIFLVSFFFGGWATSRLAVGESKLEAVLYGMILWGLLFVGLFAPGRRGRPGRLSGMVGDATGVGADRGRRRAAGLQRRDAPRDGPVAEERIDRTRRARVRRRGRRRRPRGRPARRARRPGGRCSAWSSR